MTGFKAINARLSILVKILLVVAAGLAIAVPTAAASTGSTSGTGTTAGTGDAAGRPAMISPLPAPGPRTAAQAATASQACAQYAVRAGWVNNGYFGGDLVTAIAICVAESTGDPRLYVCDQNGAVVGQGEFVQGQPVDCPAGTTSYDRGLWQLNSVAAAGVSDSCAFNPVCNAGQAYLASGRGTTFAPWSSYDQDVYTPFIDPAQTVVGTLTSGTVTSAMLGECLAQSKSAAGAKVVVANCGSGGTSQQWAVAGHKLKSGSVCASVSSVTASTAGVVLRKCAALKVQEWVAHGRNELRNVASGKCLTDPSLTAGTPVSVTACAAAKDQVWWLP